MLWSAYQFVVSYVMIFVAEFWLLARLLGNRLEVAPAWIRYAVLAIMLLLPALVALAIMNAPSTDLPDSY